jgi:vitamin B12 transporter
MTAFNTIGNTHGNVRGTLGAITTPEAPARERQKPWSTGRGLQVHSRLSGTVASRRSRPCTAFFRSTAFRFIAPLMWALGGSCIAMAQNSAPSASADVGKVEEVLVSSRTPDLIDQIGVSVSVLDEEMMQSLGYPDLASLLDTQPGVTVTVDGGYGKAAAVRIRGEEGYRTRIVLDGINIADPSSPQVSPRIEHLVSSGLTRVEILRGPQGLLWGADAGGVILMSTIDAAAESGLGGFLEAGSDDFYQGVINGVLSTDKLTTAVSLSQLETDGFNAREIDSADPDRDGYENTTAHGAIDWAISNAISLNFAATDISGDNEYDGCYDTATFALIHDCDDEYEQQAWRGALRFASERHTVELSYASSDTDRAFFSASILSYETEGETDTTSLTGAWRLTDNTRLTYGVDHEEQALSDASTDWSRDNTGIYLEAQQRLGSGVMTFGWRHDDNDDFGEFESWRISGRYELTGMAEGWALRAAIGTGFRAPSLYEIAYNKGPFAYPPASSAPLLEEESEGWEIAVVGSLENLDLELIWFDQEIDNEIIFDLATYSGYLQTQGTSRSEGIELVASLPLSAHWLIEGNFTTIDATQQNGADRAYRPEQTGRASVVYADAKWRARLTTRYTGEAIDPFMTSIDDTLTVDLTAQWQVSEQWTLEARLLNLTDHTDQQLPGYNMPGMTAYAGVRIKL